MPKPWAKLEQNYINHPKFLALSANAICLWHEGKNYCDMHHTDGMIPREALKTFRWQSAKAIELLSRSCGEKPNRQPYAPLWEALNVGGVRYFKMHDYLDHNDCRDEVLQRFEDLDDVAALRRIANKERQRKFREERKAALASHTRNALRHAENDVTCPTPIELEPVPIQRTHARAPDPDAPLFDRARAFIERYPRIYAEYRQGAHYHVKEARDFPKVLELVRGWPDDDRLDAMFKVFLHLKGKDVLNQPGTPGQFLHHAPECDQLLRANGR